MSRAKDSDSINTLLTHYPKPLVDLHQVAPDFYTALQVKRHRQLGALSALLGDIRATSEDDWDDPSAIREASAEIDELLRELVDQLGHDLLFKNPTPLPSRGPISGWSND